MANENYYDEMRAINQFYHELNVAGYVTPPMFSECKAIEHFVETGEEKYDNVAYIHTSSN